MNTNIKARIYIVAERLESLRTFIINEIENIKKSEKEITGNLIHHIDTVKRIEEVQSILNDIIVNNLYLENKPDKVKLNYFLDVRNLSDQLKGQK